MTKEQIKRAYDAGRLALPTATFRLLALGLTLAEADDVLFPCPVIKVQHAMNPDSIRFRSGPDDFDELTSSWYC